MKKYLAFFILTLLCSCVKNNEDLIVNSAAQQVFGIEFDKNQDWCTTINGSIKIENQNASKVAVLALVDGQLRKLNEADYYDGIVINYDAPKGSEIYVMTTSLDGKQYFLTEGYATRGVSISVPSTQPQITGEVESYAKQRGYPGFENDKLYTTNLSSISINGYTEAFTNIFRAAVFTYLPNGRKYNNLPKILANGYYNNDCYAVTTGEEPIVVSMVYKNDGGYHEVETGELYYYYFKGNLSVDEIKALPKYKALDVSATMSADDVINKHDSYVLAYFDGETPTYNFPKGYNIGFMLRMNFKDAVKKGELYFDGRLNKEINKHGHFASSKLGDSDPRMCWLSINNLMFMCCEAGTDADFNDAVFEIEGGIEPIIIPIDPVYNFYTFLYEDRAVGDYDMNDVVLRGTRIDETHVKWQIMATGAYDELYIQGLNGSIINSSKEIHSYFEVPQETYVNVGKEITKNIIEETFKVDKDFSFLTNPPSIKNNTMNTVISLATAGQDPHAIMVPFEIKWPIERICIKDAYLEFNNWGANSVISTDWYTRPEEDKIVQ